MKTKPLCLVLALIILLLASGQTGPSGTGQAAPLHAVQTPVLKWQRGGCYTSWCETGWYSSPAVADLDNDRKMEVIGATYSLFVLNGEDGTVQWSTDPPGSRVWPGVVVADVNNDGDLEVVTAHGGGYVHVFNHAGAIVWSRQPAANELRGLAAHDLDGDGTLEIVVTGAVYGTVNTWVLEHDGTTRAGWPQLSNDSGYAYGVFNDNAAVGDLDGDGAGEIVVPSDVHYICAYEANGSQIPAHSMYGGKAWGKVGVWESLEIELRGWGHCSGERKERYRTNFAHGAGVLADVNRDGIIEIVVTGNVYDCGVGHPPGKYNGVYVFNSDRSRFNQDGYDWQTPPVDTGAPLSEDYSVIENSQPNPAVADLDGDGNKEIVYSSYDGRVHAFWLDKTEHHSWPYDVYDASEGFYRFASEPAIADLDNDGYAEVIFASWVQKGTHRTGKLHILNYLGNLVKEVDLPLAFGSPDWNGALAAPTLANIDADADLEAVLLTAHSGLVAYDLPGTANARVLWGTGRGNYQRTGSVLGPAFAKQVDRGAAAQGDILAYTINLNGSGAAITMTDAIPAGTAYVPDSAARDPEIGALVADATTITWTGAISRSTDLRITLAVTVTTADTQAIINQAQISDGQQVVTVSATTIVNGLETYLPHMQRH